MFQISDALWDKIEAVLPKPKRRKKSLGGRPRIPDRVVLDGIFYVLRTGSQWAALDATGICKHTTAHSRFQEWCRKGVFRKIWKAALEEYDDCEGIDWRWQSMDGAMTKAPLGGEKDGTQPHGSRQTRGETQPAHRRRGNAHRPRGGRREPQ